MSTMFDKSLVRKIIFPLLFVSILFCTLTPQIVKAQEDETELFLVAQKAFEDGFYDVAIRYIEQFLPKFPLSQRRVQANLLLGQCYFFKAQYLKAYDIFQSLLSFSELKDATLFWLGETLLKGVDYKKAEENYKQLIQTFPDSSYVPQTLYSLGWVYYEQLQFAEAFEVFEKLIKTYPKNQLAEDALFKMAEGEYNLKDYQKAVSYFQNFVLRYPESNRHAESYFYMAESHYYLGQYLEAITYYAKAAQIAYDSKLTVMSKVSLGWCYLKLEKYQLAQQNFDEALVLAKEKNILTDDIFLGQATLYSQMKEYAKALEAYKQLIENFPNSQRVVEGLLGKANSYYSLGDFDNATKTYRTIINKYSQDPAQKDIVEKTYFGLAWCYLKVGNIDLSVETFNIIKDKSENKTVKISALTQIGDAYQDINEYQKAIDIYDQILRDFPDSIYTDYVQYRQGLSLLKSEKVDNAVISFQSLLANFPQSKYIRDVKYYLALAYFKNNDWASSLKQVEAFIKEFPDNNEFLADANYLLGLSQFNLNNFKEALKTFQSVIVNYPEQSAIIRNAELYLGKCFHRLGDSSEAIKKFKFLILKYPQTDIAEEATIWLGDYYLENTQYDQALAYYQEFINSFPSSEKLSSVYYEMGQVYVAKEQYNEAISILKKINDPKNTEINTKAKLAIADIFSKELKPSEASETYQAIIANSPEFRRDAYGKIAELYKNNREYEKAVDAYREALKAEKSLSQLKNVQLQFLLADAYELKGDDMTAVGEYLKIPYLYVKEVSWVVKSYLRAGRIFENKEDWDQARLVYQKILELKSEESKFAQERIEAIEASSQKQFNSTK